MNEDLLSVGDILCSAVGVVTLYCKNENSDALFLSATDFDIATVVDISKMMSPISDDYKIKSIRVLVNNEIFFVNRRNFKQWRSINK
jgi:hypothetical protein